MPMLSNPAPSAAAEGGRRGIAGYELNDDNDYDIDDQEVGTVELWKDEFRPTNGFNSYSDTGNNNHNGHEKNGQFHHLPSSFLTSSSASSSSSSFEMVPTITRKNNETANKYYVDNDNDDDDSDNGMHFNYDDDEDYYNSDDDDEEDDDRRLVHQQQQQHSKRRRQLQHDADDENGNSGDDYHLQSNLLSLLLSKSAYQYLYPPQVPKSIQLYRMENIAIPACYLLVGILQGLSGPFTNVYPLDLNASEAQQVSRV